MPGFHRFAAVLLLISLVALILAACGDSDDAEETATPASTATSTPPSQSAGPSASSSDEPTAPPIESPVLETYANDKFSYEVTVPVGWRLATHFMDEFAERQSDPSFTSTPDDYAMLTAISEQEEIAAVQAAAVTVAIAAEPWFRFAEGHSIHLRPTFQTLDEFIADVNEPGFSVSNTDVREVMLTSGESATRLTQRTRSDNGDLTFDSVYVPISQTTACRLGPCRGIVMEILRTADYDTAAFESVFRSFESPPAPTP